MPKFSLADYTLLSVVFLQAQEAKTQVQYFDFEPDIVLDENAEYLLLDIDQDGIDDIRFGHIKGDYYTYWGEEQRYFDVVFVGAENTGNWIAGSRYSLGTSSGSTSFSYRPYLIPFGYPIGVLLSFIDDDGQFISTFVVSSLGEITEEEENWPASVEGYFGVRIERDEHYYYGWVRAMVADSAKSITIYDYAYETIADQTIIAGDSLGTLAVSTSSLQPIDFTCYGTTLFIQSNESYNMHQTELIIYDLSGKKVFSKQLSAGDKSIQLPLQTGIYIATCSIKGNVISKTISIF